MDSRAPLGGIVVATDFSAHARAAVDRATRLPFGPGSRIDLLHVGAEEQRVDATRLLDEARGEVARTLATSREVGVDLVASFADGPPFLAIADHAHHARAELVVLGRHGERRFRDALIGSTAERVIRHGSVSVLVVAGSPEAPYRRPLVAVDMSASSRLALELAVRICDPDLAKIDVIHVVSLPNRLHVSETQLVPALERRLDELKRDRRAEVAAFLATVDLGVRWNIEVASGDPRAVILGEVKARGIDVVALGTKGRTGIPRVLVGSVAEAVVRAAPCDVLVARLPERP
jgi:nucleotide-binding universal stress UspA family protein